MCVRGQYHGKEGRLRRAWGRGQRRPAVTATGFGRSTWIWDAGGRWEVRVAADSVKIGLRSGPQTPAPLSAELVPLPPTPEPPNRPPPPSLQIPGPSPRPCPSPRTPSLDTSHGRKRGLGKPRPSTARPFRTRPSAWRLPRQRRDFPSAPRSRQSAFRPETPDRPNRKGLGSSCSLGSPSHGLAPGRRRCPRHLPAGPGVPPREGPGATAGGPG